MGELELITSWGEPENAAPQPTLPHFSAPTPKTVASWPPALVIELALGYETTDDILDRFNITPSEYLHMEAHPQFQKDLAAARQDILTNGLTFKRKAQAQAEEYLVVLDEIITDPSVPASTRTNAIKDVVRWAGYEPKEDKKSDSGPSQQFNIQIVL